jgi:hypothetical protein
MLTAGGEVEHHEFLSATADAQKWSASLTSRFFSPPPPPPRKTLNSHQIGDRMGPTRGLNRSENNKSSASEGNRTPFAGNSAQYSHSTGCVTPRVIRWTCGLAVLTVFWNVSHLIPLARNQNSINFNFSPSKQVPTSDWTTGVSVHILIQNSAIILQFSAVWHHEIN